MLIMYLFLWSITSFPKMQIQDWQSVIIHQALVLLVGEKRLPFIAGKAGLGLW